MPTNKGPCQIRKKPTAPAPKGNYERNEPTPGWDVGLSNKQKVFVLTYFETGNRSAAGRAAGMVRNVTTRAYALFKTIAICNAWAMLHGAQPPYPEKLPKIGGKAARLEDKKLPDPDAVAKTAPRDYKTFAGKRLLMEARKTPLDVMVETMCATWDAAEKLMDDDVRGQKVDSQESLAGKRAACVIAKDAAPYMHSRLIATEAKVTTDDLGSMSTADLKKELTDAQKVIDKLVGVTGTTPVGVGSFSSEDAGGDVGEQDDDLPPVH